MTMYALNLALGVGTISGTPVLPRDNIKKDFFERCLGDGVGDDNARVLELLHLLHEIRHRDGDTRAERLLAVPTSWVWTLINIIITSFLQCILLLNLRRRIFSTQACVPHLVAVAYGRCLCNHTINLLFLTREFTFSRIKWVVRIKNVCGPSQQTDKTSPYKAIRNNDVGEKVLNTR